MKKYSVAIIDYQMSNLFSISNALNALDINSVITSDPKVILQSDGAILPGVGSYPEAVISLHDLDLFETIKNFINTGKPFMGICLGLQLLFNNSEEFKLTEGLGVIEGATKKFIDKSIVKTVPHVGWNKIEIIESDHDIQNYPFKDITCDDFFYFVHSLYVEPANLDSVKSFTDHEGFNFCSSIMHENIFASQFHPEKSGKRGLQILQNFFN
jgi:imidazole glycerol-phosphate synthase subunit HisH